MVASTKSKAAEDESNQITIVLPGDNVSSQIAQLKNRITSSKKKNKPIKIGKGLQICSPKDNDDDAVIDGNDDIQALPQIKSTLAGRLHYNSSSHTAFVLANTKRYIPQIHDRVICIIEDRSGDNYRVTIPGCTMGSNIMLNTTSFEGATKRNRPHLGTGDLVYARIMHCFDYSSEIEVSCTVNSGRDDVQSGGLNDDGGASRKDWMTDEGTYGQLKNGTCLQISIGLAHELLNLNNVVLQCLGNSGIKFEVCIGVNGFLWIHSERPEYTILVINAIANSEVMAEDQVRAMVKTLVRTVRQSMLEES
jgi:exosome complex component RRP40